MKKLLLIICLLVPMFVSSVLFVNADVSADYDLVYMANDGGSETIYITSDTAETVKYLEDGGLRVEWGEWSGSRIPLYISADNNTDLGNSAITVIDEDDPDDYDIIHVLVYDNYQTEIYSAKAGKGKATIRWNKGLSDYYQMQYKKAGESWKNVFFGKRTKWTVYGLNKGKKYSFRVRPVTPSYEWGNLYGPWSGVVSLRVK